MCSVSSLYGDQAITSLLKSCKGWGKVLWEIQNLKIQMFMDHTLTFSHLIHIVQHLSYEQTKYINHGDRSSYSE